MSTFNWVAGTIVFILSVILGYVIYRFRKNKRKLEKCSQEKYEVDNLRLTAQGKFEESEKELEKCRKKVGGLDRDLDREVRRNRQEEISRLLDKVEEEERKVVSGELPPMMLMGGAVYKLERAMEIRLAHGIKITDEPRFQRLKTYFEKLRRGEGEVFVE